MTDTTDGRRPRARALALLVALTALLLAPAVAFAPSAFASQTGPGGYTISPNAARGTSGSTTYTVTKASAANWDVRINQYTGSTAVHTLGSGESATGICVSGSSPWTTFNSSGVATISVPWPGSGACSSDLPLRFELVGGPSDVYLDHFDFAVPDTTPPSVPAPTITAATSGGGITVNWSASTDAGSGVAGYQYSLDGGTYVPCSPTGLIHCPPISFPDAGAALAHTIAVKAQDVAGNVSAAGTDSYGGCNIDGSTEGCQTWGTGGGGDWGGGDHTNDCPFLSLEFHCLTWAGDRPDLNDVPPHRWTFSVKDEGESLVPDDYLVGWACVDSTGAVTVHEGMASFYAMVQRDFVVDCGSGSVGNFYVLGDVAAGNPDYTDAILWWGFFRPGDIEGRGAGWGSTPPGTGGTCVGDGSCSTYNFDDNITTGATPQPTTVAPPVTVPGVSGPSPGCGFSFTDPSSWAGAATCEIVRMVRKMIDAVGAVLTFLRGIPGWFIPRGAVLQADFGNVKSSWDASPVGTLTGAVGDIADPVTSLSDTTTSCDGPLITLPLPLEHTVAIHPFSACSELAGYILGVTMPLERAFIYLAAFFVALRIVSRTVGLDGPDQQAQAA